MFMSQAIVIGSVPAMHYRPKVGRSPTMVDASTAQLIQEAAQELFDRGTSVVTAYRNAFEQADVQLDAIRYVFWSWRALQTFVEPRRALLQDEPFPAIFSFTEGGATAQVHPSSVFSSATHYVTSRDRKSVDLVRWNSLPY